MRFIDALKLNLEAGRGGKGIISFRREAHVDRGGPDGGDGGRGGDIFVRGSTSLNTLYHLYNLGKIKAQNGQNGGNQNKRGASGQKLVIEVPLGTVVLDERGALICDVIDSGEYLVAKGGEGGRGNARFRSSKNPAPRICENGDLGESFEATFELKFISDIGFVGKPSAGKSSLLKSISNAKAKVGAYDFTTLVPQLGLVKYKDTGFVVADLPGIISGASEGRGLGIRFLKHIERAKVLVYVVDVGEAQKDPLKDLEEVILEVSKFKDSSWAKPNFILAHKSDLPNFAKNFEALKASFREAEIIPTSVFEPLQLAKLREYLFKWVSGAQRVELKKYFSEVNYCLEEEIKVVRVLANLFEISGSKVMKIYNKIPLNSTENLQRFNHQLKEIGLWELLIEKGVSSGDIVRIGSYEFSWIEEDF